MTQNPTSVFGEDFWGQKCWCYNPGNPRTGRIQLCNPRTASHISQRPRCKMLPVPCSGSLFLSAGQLPLPPPSLPRVFPLCKLLPVSPRLLLSAWPSEEAGHRSAEWEEGSVINGILCCLHKHSGHTDSWKVSSSQGGQTQRNTRWLLQRAF